MGRLMEYVLQSTWLQSTIVALLVGGAAVYVGRVLWRTLRGRGGTCHCGAEGSTCVNAAPRTTTKAE